MISRRDFVGRLARSLAVGVASSGAAAAAWRGYSLLNGNTDPPVVIAGSGASAIACARALLDRNLPVLMLEGGPFNDVSLSPEVDEDVAEAPYTTAPHRPFEWTRVRQVGGKLSRWHTHARRFTRADLDGAGAGVSGTAWPISIEALSPYYDRAEAMLGLDEVRGPTAPLKPIEVALRDALATEAVEVVESRHACTQRSYGDRGYERFDGITWLKLNLLAHPKFSLLPYASVRHVVHDRSTRRAAAVEYFDGIERRLRAVRARAVVLAAGAIESTKIVLASELADRRDALGRGLMDRVCVEIAGTMEVPAPRREGRRSRRRRRNERDAVAVPDWLGAYIPRQGEPHDAGSMYGFEVHASEARPNVWSVRLVGRGTMLSSPSNRVLLDDRAGPTGARVVTIDCAHGPQDDALVRAMSARGRQLLELAGASDITVSASPPGTAGSPVGTCRIGADPYTSVLTPDGLVRGVDNVFVVDGAAFPSLPCEPPTLTIMAMAFRAGALLAV